LDCRGSSERRGSNQSQASVWYHAAGGGESCRWSKMTPHHVLVQRDEMVPSFGEVDVIHSQDEYAKSMEIELVKLAPDKMRHSLQLKVKTIETLGSERCKYQMAT
jgi:hypothetical protein